MKSLEIEEIINEIDIVLLNIYNWKDLKAPQEACELSLCYIADGVVGNSREFIDSMAKFKTKRDGYTIDMNNYWWLDGSKWIHGACVVHDITAWFKPRIHFLEDWKRYLKWLKIK